MSKGETLIRTILSQNKINFKEQYVFKNLKSPKGKSLMFDFAIFKNEQLHCLIEYQGIQHYDKTSKYYSEDGQIRDNQKKDYCKKNNIKLIEIPYIDYDKINWEYLKNICNL